MALKADFVVIGAGVVGLAIGRALSPHGSTVIVESEAGLGRHASSRNSEVLHAGFYYPTHSRKARTCVLGAKMLMEYSDLKAIPIAMIGKLIVAAHDAELDTLEKLHAQGIDNGVKGLSLIGEGKLKQLEPAVRGCGALWSEQTGIIDSHQLLLALEEDIVESGGVIALQSPVTGGHCHADGFSLHIGGREPSEIHGRIVINAAGLFAPSLAQTLGIRSQAIPQGRLVKGNYLSYRGPSPFKRLVYPLPSTDGLGIHATLDFSGKTRFGPDAKIVDKIDYEVRSDVTTRFAAAICRYWPGLDASRLIPDYAGIRSKIVPESKGQPADFLIEDHRQEKAGLISLFGIESPGLTASLALAEEIREMIVGGSI